MNRCDIVIKGGEIADSNGPKGFLDIAITNGRISDISERILASYQPDYVVDATAKYVLPGVVDPHVHLSTWFGCGHGHKSLVASGVTTAIDFAGPVEDVVKTAATNGAGLEIGIVEAIMPADIRGNISDVISSIYDKGALGIKVLGGHFPIDPEAMRAIGEIANERNDFLYAIHAGSSRTPGDFRGLTEAIELLKGTPAYIAHLNSYCRGETKHELLETEEAFRMIQDSHLLTESYLAVINGCPGELNNSELISAATKRHLKRLGLPENADGLEEALATEKAYAVHPETPTGLISGELAVQYWKAHGSKITVSFAVNKMSVGIAMLTEPSSNDDGTYVVPNLCSDGGGIPRNVTLEYGMHLVKWRVISIGDLITKYSKNPAAFLGIEKGTIAPGADADIVIVNPEDGKVDITIGGGKILYRENRVFGKSARFLTNLTGKATEIPSERSTRRVNLSRSTVFGRI